MKPERVEDITKNAASQRELLARVDDGEPIFILRARDDLACATIRFWLGLAARNNVRREKLDEASAHLAMFQEWARTHPTKLPD